MTTDKFFSTHWYRSTLLEELGLSENPKSFEELRKMVAVKHFGQVVVDSNSFRILWLKDQINMYKGIIETDQANFNTFTKAQKKRSILPVSILEDKETLTKLQIELSTFI